MTMRRSPFSVVLSLFFQALTLAVAFDPSQQDESTITATPILQDVLKEISVKQKWNLEEVRFSKLEVKKLRVGTGRSFEIRIRLGKSRFIFVFPDEVTDWRRSGGGRQVELTEVIREVNSSKVLDPIVLKGPLEIRVAGDYRLSLALPVLSRSSLTVSSPEKMTQMDRSNESLCSLSTLARSVTYDFALKLCYCVSSRCRKCRKSLEASALLKPESSFRCIEDDICCGNSLSLMIRAYDLVFQMNITHNGLKRVLVSEGISVEIREAQAVSLFHSSSRRFAATVEPVDVKEGSCVWSSLGSVCVPLPPIQIIGSASLVAFKTPKTDSQIKASYLSDDTIQLLPEKCYSKAHTYKQHHLPTDLLGLKINKLERVLNSLQNSGNEQSVSYVTAKLKASGMVRFQLDIERRIGSNESVTSKRAEWRTKAKIERVWFEVTAKVEGDKLKPVGLRKVVPFIEVDTEAWSNLMSNMSFTKFPSILVPQEALTLDVKW
ncbi:unnamed protein product [Thlaspi arvense]|uniref:Uncharacterized protein n=1 Tax=Thlaspi arvense TaxID=13288 RepID=A0AAU9RBK1_THLAR|nr:unnamed protein product [Thlaspi arvense]